MSAPKQNGIAFRVQMMQMVFFSRKRWYLPVNPHGLTTQKIIIITAVRTSSLTSKVFFYFISEVGKPSIMACTN